MVIFSIEDFLVYGFIATAPRWKEGRRFTTEAEDSPPRHKGTKGNQMINDAQRNEDSG
jgi:hypothetical protein